MAAPIVSWFNADNTSQVTQWDIGTVDAGSISQPETGFGVLIWNNRGGASDVSDMTSTTITTKDSGGGNTGELVEDTWIEAKVNSLAEANFFAMGGTVTRDLKADDANISTGIIKGSLNDGTTANAPANFCSVNLRANVPPLATAGLVNFVTRVSYQYV
jgi:hypothetical protein